MADRLAVNAERYFWHYPSTSMRVSAGFCADGRKSFITGVSINESPAFDAEPRPKFE
jgi:hypothetical protein